MVLFYPDFALTTAGGDVSVIATWKSYVLQNRELISGQNDHSVWKNHANYESWRTPRWCRDGFIYNAVLPATRPAAEYTPRLVPHHAEALVPLEAPFILWHDALVAMK